MGVNSTTSANRMLAASSSAAIVRWSAFNASRDLRENVEQQHFGTLLEEIPPTYKVVEEPEGDCDHRAYIEHEKPRHESFG